MTPEVTAGDREAAVRVNNLAARLEPHQMLQMPVSVYRAALATVRADEYAKHIEIMQPWQARVTSLENTAENWKQEAQRVTDVATKYMDQVTALEEEKKILGGILRSQTDEIVRLQAALREIADEGCTDRGCDGRGDQREHTLQCPVGIMAALHKALAPGAGDWCDVCHAPQMVMPDGEHKCGEKYERL